MSKLRPQGGGYVNSVSLRFNPTDADALRELGLDYADLTQDLVYDCAYLHVGIAFWDNFNPPFERSPNARRIYYKIAAAATFCDW